MSLEQDEPDEVSPRVRALIKEFVDADGERQRHSSALNRERVERTQTQIIQMTANLGTEGFSIFRKELEILEQESKKRFDSEVYRYCLAGQTDPHLADFYDNEVVASQIGLWQELRAFRSVESILQQLQ